MVAPTNPNIGAAVPESALEWDIDYTDDFDGPDGAAQDVNNTFKWLNMTEGLHQTGNKDLDYLGNPNVGGNANYRRWSAFYGRIPGGPYHADKVARIENNELVMGGVFTDELDPGRIEYVQGTETVKLNEHRVYTAFGVTSDRVWSNSAGGHIIDPNAPDIYMEKNSAIQFRASFEEMRTRSFRFSVYLLPRLPYESLSYDNDSSHVEVDLPEYDYTPGFEGYLQQKVIGGQAGQTPNGSVDVLTNTGIDVSVGYHDHTFLWLDNALVWLVDGVETQRDEILIPDVPHYLVFSREINSGAKLYYGEYDTSQIYLEGAYVIYNGSTYRKDGVIGGSGSDLPGWSKVSFIPPSEFGRPDTDLIACPPFIPEDVGLFAQNVWFDRDKINTDVARISYMRTWRVKGTTPPPDPIVNTRRLEFSKGIGEDQVEEITLLDPREGETYQWTKTVDDSVLEFIGPTNQPSVKIKSHEVSSRTINDVQLEIDTDAPVSNGIPSINSPASIQSGTHTFSWAANGLSVDAWRLVITSQDLLTTYLDTGQITQTQAQNTTVFPMDGSIIVARLYFTSGAFTTSTSRNYTLPTGANTTPQITAPTAGSTYNAGPVAFNWVANGAPETDVWNIKVGNDTNDAHYHSSSDIVGNSYNLDAGMPRDGSQVKITLRWKATGSSFHSSRSTSITVTASN